MNTRDALKKLLPLLDDELVVCANGFISRDAFNARERPQNFYMLGSMGQASSIGLGLALAKPARKVVVFDGDGNLLMNLGILTMIGALSPRNLVHIVFDNECYDSTGGQPTVSRNIDLSEVAKICGIRSVKKIGRAGSPADIFKKFLKEDGPHFLLIKVGRDSKEPLPRVNIPPDEIARRFASCAII